MLYSTSTVFQVFCILLCEVALLNSTPYSVVLIDMQQTGGEPPRPLIGPLQPAASHIFAASSPEPKRTATRSRTITTNHSSSLSPNTRPTIHPQLREGIFTRVIVVALTSGRKRYDTIRGNKWSREAVIEDECAFSSFIPIEIEREWRE